MKKYALPLLLLCGCQKELEQYPAVPQSNNAEATADSAYFYGFSGWDGGTCSAKYNFRATLEWNDRFDIPYDSCRIISCTWLLKKSKDVKLRLARQWINDTKFAYDISNLNGGDRFTIAYRDGTRHPINESPVLMAGNIKNLYLQTQADSDSANIGFRMILDSIVIVRISTGEVCPTNLREKWSRDGHTGFYGQGLLAEFF